MPLSPEWANLPKRKCDECGKSYKPVKPLREGERGFCCANHRKSYHKHGGAYRKLKGEMQKMVTARMNELEKRIREIVREELQRATVLDAESRECSVVPYMPPLTQQERDVLSRRMREANRPSR